MHKLFLISSFILLYLPGAYGQPAIDIPLSGSDGTATIPLAVGLDLSATDCIDPALGESNLPGLPPTGVFDIRFILPASCGPLNGVLLDYRNAPVFPFTGIIQHSLHVQRAVEETAVTITYDLPIGAVMTIQDQFGGVVYNSGPLTGTGSFIINGVGSFLSYFYVIMEYSTPCDCAPAFAIAPPSLDFGSIGVGLLSILQATVVNPGLDVLKISNITSSDTQFTFSPNSFPISILPGGYQIFDITFSPTEAGPQSANLTFTHNAAGSPFIYNVQGNGYLPEPIFSVNPTFLNFDNVYLGSSSENQTFTITNAGSGTLTINAGNISIVGTDESQFVLTDANTYPIYLAGGQLVYVNVKFSPTATGTKTANLQIIDNLTDAVHTVPLSGVGVAPPEIPYSTDFETFITGQQVVCQDSINWITWSNLPCDVVEDPYISTTYAYSGFNSAKIVQNNDLVRPLLSQTTGKWQISFMVYIPTGKTGYFNTLALLAGESSVWGMDCYFNLAGAGMLNAGGVNTASFTWIPNSWKKVQLVIDLNNDDAEFWYNNTLVCSWQWSLGSLGTGCPLKLDANDFFGATANDEMYFDDYSFRPFTNTFQLSVNVTNGWNMVSVPGLNSPDQNVNTWWVNHIGTVYKFTLGTGYSGITTTTPGEGYWMKQVGDNVYNTGDEWPASGIEIVPHNHIDVSAGWNMFGGYENIIDATALTTTPPGQIVFPIYKFVPGTGYQATPQILPGYGYWVKVSSNCQINILDEVSKGLAKEVNYFKDDLPDGKAGWGRITVTDAAGSSYTLYAVKGEVDLNQYERPPLPP